MKIKKVLSLFIIFCFITSLSGCFNRIPGKIWKNPNLEDLCILIDVMVGDGLLEDVYENNVITQVKWQKLRLTEKESLIYPELSAALNQYNADGLVSAQSLMDEFAISAKELEGDESNPAYCQAESKVYMQRADSRIVSLLESIEKYTGGVHPDFWVNGINFNADTGKKAELTEILTDTSKLPSILENKITKKYSEVAFYDLKDTLSKYKPEDFTWTIDYQGITFWFSPYEIAAYSVGTLSARILFDEFPDIFNKDYTVTPGNYIQSIPIGIDIEFDLGSDEEALISVQALPDQYGSYNMLSVTVNGKTFTDEINYAYDFDVYLAHIGDKNYIYSVSSTDNDYHIFNTWDINGETPEITQELRNTKLESEFIEEDETVYKCAFNTPELFCLEKRFEILGSRGAIANFKIDKTNGCAVIADSAFTFTYGHDVKTAMALEAKVLPDMEAAEIPFGTLLTPYQTDGETFIDLKTEDEKIIRLSINASRLPITVNGIPEDECFENLLYAG